MAAAAAPHLPAISAQSVRRDFQDQTVSIILMVFLLFFFLGSKFELGIPLRIEDLLFLMLLPLGYRYAAREKSPLFFWIVAYFAVNLVPYFVAAVTGYDLGIYPIIIMKEIEYFYIAYLICVNRSRWVLGLIDLLAVALILNGVRAIVQGEVTYYGIGTFGNYDSPSISGALFLFSTVWLHIRSKLLPTRRLQWAAWPLLLAGSGCVVATVSRSGIGAIVVYWIAYAVIAHLRTIPLLIGFGAVVPAIAQKIAGSFGIDLWVIGAVARRLGAAGSAAVERTTKWQGYLAHLEPYDYVFGRGKGFPNALNNYMGMGVDSQYVRIILENGIVGFLILAAILLTMLREMYLRRGEYEHGWAVVAAMMVLSVPLEALQVSKPGGFFWLILFYLLMCQRKPLPPARP